MTDNNPKRFSATGNWSRPDNVKRLKWIDNKWTEVPAPPKPRITKDRFTFLWACVAALMFALFIESARSAESDLELSVWLVFALGWLVTGAVNLVKLLFGKEVRI